MVKNEMLIDYMWIRSCFMKYLNKQENKVDLIRPNVEYALEIFFILWTVFHIILECD